MINFTGFNYIVNISDAKCGVLGVPNRKLVQTCRLCSDFVPFLSHLFFFFFMNKICPSLLDVTLPSLGIPMPRFPLSHLKAIKVER